MRDFGLNSSQNFPCTFRTDILRKSPFEYQCLHEPHCENMKLQFQGTVNLVLVGFVGLCVKMFCIRLAVQYSLSASNVNQKPHPHSYCNITLYFIPCNCLLPSLTHCGRVTQICVFNTVKLGTSASSPQCHSTRRNVSRDITPSSTTRVFDVYFLKI